MSDKPDRLPSLSDLMSRQQKRADQHNPDVTMSLRNRLQAFIDEHCKWCDTVAATHVSQLKKAAAEHCRISVRDIGPHSESSLSVAVLVTVVER